MVDQVTAMRTIRTRVQAQYETGQSLPVYYANGPAPSHGIGLHVRAIITLLPGDQITVGPSPLSRHRGLLQLRFYSPIGEGTKGTEDVLLATLRQFRLLTANGVTWGVPYISDSRRTDDEAYWLTDVFCPWQTDET